jgi:hypothetical protein
MKSVEIATKLTNRDLEISIWILIMSTIAAIYFNFILTNNNDEKNDNVNAIIISVWLIALVAVVAYAKRKRRIKKILNGDHYLSWKYKNGNELIITKGLLIRYSVEEKIKKVDRKIDDVTWGLENIKSALEDLREGELPISLVIPTIHFSASSNIVPNVIDFMKSNTILYFTLVEIQFVRLLMIRIEYKTKNLGATYSLNYPITSDIDFTKEDFKVFLRKINQSFNVNYYYIDEEVLNCIK